MGAGDQNQDALEESKGPPVNAAGSPENFMISGIKQWEQELLGDYESQSDEIGMMDLNVISEENPENHEAGPSLAAMPSTLPSMGELAGNSNTKTT